MADQSALALARQAKGARDLTRDGSHRSRAVQKWGEMVDQGPDTRSSHGSMMKTSRLIASAFLMTQSVYLRACSPVHPMILCLVMQLGHLFTHFIEALLRYKPAKNGIRKKKDVMRTPFVPRCHPPFHRCAEWTMAMVKQSIPCGLLHGLHGSRRS